MKRALLDENDFDVTVSLQFRAIKMAIEEIRLALQEVEAGKVIHVQVPRIE